MKKISWLKIAFLIIGCFLFAWIAKDELTLFIFSGKSFDGRGALFQVLLIGIYTLIFMSIYILLIAFIKKSFAFWRRANLYRVNQEQPEQYNNFYPQIEGVRALAAILVAVYHIWTRNVSGAVDVFFVISGFLITSSLMKQVERAGKIDILAYLSGLLLRLAPAALTVILVVGVGSFFLLPTVRYYEISLELLASVLYYENWQLAFNSIDYLARENNQSPVQHFWALSMQGQFYLLWSIVLIIVLVIHQKLNFSFNKIVLACFGIIFFTSLSYSIVSTYFIDQIWAYFDTFARIWEFAIGGLLALKVSRFVLDSKLRSVLGWVGLLGIASCGVIFNVGNVFPGFIALWPTTSAVLVILAGANGPWWGPQKVLSSKIAVGLGSISYGIYLWHWPLLIFYKHVYSIEQVSFGAGLVIIFTSIALSFLTISYIEKPIRGLKTISTKKNLLVNATLFLPMVSLIGGWIFLLNSTPRYIDNLNRMQYPGAVALADKGSFFVPRLDILPDLTQAKRDLPRSYSDGCHLDRKTSEPTLCIYGVDDGFEKTLAVVGGSHSAHWLPALEIIAHKNNWRIIYTTKSACRFYILLNDNDTCINWNERVLMELIKLKPDLVFVTANVLSEPRPRESYIAGWNILNENGIRVFAIRDNPYMPFDVPECIEENLPNYQQCGADRNLVLSPEFDSSQVPPNVTILDFSNYICGDDTCQSVVGNIIVYRDSHHLTSTYVETLEPFLAPHLVSAMYADDLFP
jgi:peptidoglycan/LPS O-acetylase OafA/YrhL